MALGLAGTELPPSFSKGVPAVFVVSLLTVLAEQETEAVSQPNASLRKLASLPPGPCHDQHAAVGDVCLQDALGSSIPPRQRAFHIDHEEEFGAGKG